MTLLAAILFRLGLLPQTGIVSPGAVIVLALALLAICIAIACGFATLFEDRTTDFARWLNRRFSSPTIHTPAGIVER